MSQKRKRSEDEAHPDSGLATVYRSEPIEDRSSKFIGYYSPSLKPKELQKISEISSADHKILASRRESNQQSIRGGKTYVTDNDDDGEKYAGKKIEKVLDAMQVTGACVVARWYGGILLGPVRFTHIETCAREAVRQWQVAEIEGGTKRLKEQVDENEKQDLVTVLKERDQSIEVLRKLAIEKEEQVKQSKTAGQESANGESALQVKPVSQTKAPLDYSSIPLDKLKPLEKARDATLSFLLKRIDKAEAELASIEAKQNGDS